MDIGKQAVRFQLTTAHRPNSKICKIQDNLFCQTKQFRVIMTTYIYILEAVYKSRFIIMYKIPLLSSYMYQNYEGTLLAHHELTHLKNVQDAIFPNKMVWIDFS